MNTYKETYTKDMVIDPSITVNLSLSKQEKELIFQQLIINKFFDYPSTFPQRQDRIVTPSISYYLKIENSSKIKEVSWDDNSEFRDKNIEKGLEEISRSIIDIIESKEEYKKLPSPRGGYI